MSMRRQAIVFVAAVVAALALVPSSFGETVYALVQTNQLEHFDSATPGLPATPIAITGLQMGDTLLAIDFRPLTGELYAISSMGFMYVINTATGVATQVGMGATFPPAGFALGFLGMDFNPVVGHIRVVSSTDFNVRLNPSTGGLTATDNPLAYAAGDTNVGKNPSLVALGYSNNVSSALTTTLYGIDSTWDVLVRIGDVDGTPQSPNSGTLHTIGPLGTDTTDIAGLDISPSGTAYALLHSSIDPVGIFYTINLTSGHATQVGALAGESAIIDIAVQAGPTAVRMQSLSAVRTSRGVSVRWRTATSVDTLGFNVYREHRGQRVRLNRKLVPAASGVAGHRYSFFDRRPLRSSRYWIQAVGTDGSRSWFGPATAVRPG